MKHSKQTIATFLIASLIVFSASCKKNKQTDKPLYDVLISHRWKYDNYNIKYTCKFRTDSIMEFYDDCKDETPYMEYKWWNKDNSSFFTFMIDNIGLADSSLISEYEVLLYNDYQIKTLFYESYLYSDPVEITLKACN